MRLYEFVNTNTLVPKLVAVSDQLKSDLDNKLVDSEMSVNEFLKYLQKYDITLDKVDLYNMIKKPPLKHLIQNIQGEQVVFKGLGSPDGPEQSPDEKEKIVKSMADKART